MAGLAELISGVLSMGSGAYIGSQMEGYGKLRSLKSGTLAGVFYFIGMSLYLESSHLIGIVNDHKN